MNAMIMAPERLPIPCQLLPSRGRDRTGIAELGESGFDHACSITSSWRHRMAKAYWISAYRKVHDADKLAAYAKLAGPAITEGGGRFLVRGMPSKTYEAGLNERMVVIEFDSLDAATATHDSPGYQAALDALGDGAERDMRVVEAPE